MKTTAIVLFCLLFLSIGILYINWLEHEKKDRLEQSTIDGLTKRIEEQKDSLVSIIGLKDDTLKIAKNTILHQFYQIENERTEKENFKKKHETIRFINFNDAGRDSVLSILYPSFGSIR